MHRRSSAYSERKREERRRSILEAARKLFAERGYEKTTVRDVVNEAGTSIGNFYFYFKNKDELLTALSKYINEGVINKYQEAGDKEAGPHYNAAKYIYIYACEWFNNVEIARAYIQGTINLEIRNRVLNIHRTQLSLFIDDLSTLTGGIPIEIFLSAWQGIWLSVIELKIMNPGKETEYWAHYVIKACLRMCGLQDSYIEELFEEIKD